MPTNRYTALKTTGEKLFVLIKDGLRRMEDETRPGGWLQEHRREEDFNEICIALALLVESLDLNVDSLR